MDQIMSNTKEPNLTPLQQRLLDYGYAPGSYSNLCHTCNVLQFWVDKRAVTCESCAMKRYISALERCIVDMEDDMQCAAGLWR